MKSTTTILCLAAFMAAISSAAPIEGNNKLRMRSTEILDASKVDVVKEETEEDLQNFLDFAQGEIKGIDVGELAKAGETAKGVAEDSFSSLVDVVDGAGVVLPVSGSQINAAVERGLEAAGEQVANAPEATEKLQDRINEAM